MVICGSFALFAQVDVVVKSPKKDEIWLGMQEVRAQVLGVDSDVVKRVEFYLDGKLIREIPSPPYRFKYDFGSNPGNHTLKVLVRGVDRALKTREIRSFPIDDFQEVEVSEMVVPVVVTDRKGNYIQNLKRSDFVLEVDGRPCPITYFGHSGDTRSHLLMLIDISFSMKDKIGRVKKAAKVFLKELLTPGDRAKVVFFNDEVFEDTDFTGKLADLEDSLEVAIPYGATAMHDAIMYSLKLMKSIPGHNIIVLFSDGEDNSSYVDPFTLVKRVEKSNVVIYSIGKKVAAEKPGEYQLLLEKISSRSGGRTFFMEDAKDIEKVYSNIRSDINAQYILQFSQKNLQRLGRFHKISIRLKNDNNYKVRTIKGFYY
jgi:VWFA-related protein